MRPAYQITLGLAVAAAAGAIPVSEAARELRDRRARLAVTVAGTAASPEAAADAAGTTGGKAAPDASRIPPGVAPADASAVVAALATLDGRLLSAREIIEALDKVMDLPLSHMEDALGMIKDFRNPILSGFLHSALFARWGELDPDAARGKLTELGSNPFARFAGTASLASGWLEKDPDALVTWLTDKSIKSDPKLAEMQQMMAQSLMSGMMPLDPATAERLIAAAPREDRARLILDVAQNNPDIDITMAGQRALEESRNPDERAGIHGRIARIIADRGDVRAALDYAAGQGDARDRSAGYETTLDAWMREDKDEAASWLRGQPVETQREAVKGLRSHVSTLDSKSLASFASTVDPAVQPELWSMGVNAAANRDPADALNFLPHVKEDDRPQSYQTIATAWTKKDPEAASGWVDQLPGGPDKDKAIVGLAGAIGEKEPDSAAIWASTISDEATRAATTQRFAADWLKRDPEAAAQWIQQSPAIPPVQKQILLQPPPQ